MYPLIRTHRGIQSTGTAPHHSCLFNLPKWPLPSVAGIVTFYPDSKHRTSVNPSVAARLSHVWRNGKGGKKEKQVPDPVWAVNRWFPWMDSGKWAFSFGTILWSFGLLYSRFIFPLVFASNTYLNVFQWAPISYKDLEQCECKTGGEKAIKIFILHAPNHWFPSVRPLKSRHMNT